MLLSLLCEVFVFSARYGDDFTLLSLPEGQHSREKGTRRPGNSLYSGLPKCEHSYRSAVQGFWHR